MPNDRKAADALANRRTVARLERTVLFKWASTLARELGIEALGTEAPDSEESASIGSDGPTDIVDPTNLANPANDEELLSAAINGQALPNHFENPAPLLDASASWDDATDAALAVGAGSNGNAQP
jgi:hypothetical protein